MSTSSRRSFVQSNENVHIIQPYSHFCKYIKKTQKSEQGNVRYGMKRFFLSYYFLYFLGMFNIFAKQESQCHYQAD
jgi:hypothetical protein